MTATRPALDARGEPAEVRAAYQWCREYARGHDENFTVVSWFLPKPLRPHFFALYAFCRWTDDLGDEAQGDRLALLDAWEAELRDALAGRAARPLLVALGRTVAAFDIPHDLFLRLIEANRMDQVKTRFETAAELQRYCEHSATPVGRMVLHVLGEREERKLLLSDATCTGLQLANFWQDVSRDLEKDRVYLPTEDMHHVGYTENELRAGVVNDAFRELMRFEIARARTLFAKGRELERLVDRRVRVDVSLFRLGGEAVLDAIAATDYDVLTRRPRVSKPRKAWMALSTAIRLKFGR